MALATNATRRSIFMGVLGLVARGNAQGICPCNGWDFADLEIRQPPQKVASRFGPDAYVQIEAGLGEPQCDLTMDAWVKFENVVGDPPTPIVMIGDGSRSGSASLQLVQGRLMFHDTGNGDYHFNKWENIEAHRWYYITVIYSCSDHLYNLYVDFDLKEKGFRSHHLTQSPVGGVTWPMISLQSSVSLAMSNPEGQNTAGSGSISMAMFRVWSFQHYPPLSAAQEFCPPPGTRGLVALYVFDSLVSGTAASGACKRLRDLSMSGHDGQICGALPDSANPPDDKCTLPGYGGKFDGNSDFVALPEISQTFREIQIDVWIKFDIVEGHHPILNEVGWDLGALHYQIYNGEFGFDVNGNGDYTFAWQPNRDEWVLISVFYSATSKQLKLWVGNGQTPQEEYNTVEDVWNRDNSLPWQPIKIQNARMGAWCDGESSCGDGARSLDGQIAMFRIWTAEVGGAPRCPVELEPNLFLYYVFSESSTVLRDQSGHQRDAHIVDAHFSTDMPPADECFRETRIAPETFGGGGESSGSYYGALPVLLVVIGVSAFAVWKYRGRKAVKPGDGLSTSIYGGDDVSGPTSTMQAAPVPTSSTPVGPAPSTAGTIYD